VKAHKISLHGIIAALISEGDHGFIAAADGREICFHRSSVASGGFDGLEVSFSEALGDKGPGHVGAPDQQAPSTVTPLTRVRTNLVAPA
jgi:hypothetical protein